MKKGFAPVLIIILLAIFAVALTLFLKFRSVDTFWQKFAPAKPIPTISQTETENWSTFTDKKSRFTFKYPPEIGDPNDDPVWAGDGVVFRLIGAETKGSVVTYFGPSTMKRMEVFNFFRNAKDGTVVLPQNIVDDLNNVYGDKKPNKTNLTVSNSPAVKLITNRPAAGFDALSSYDIRTYIDKIGSMWEITANFTEASYRAEFMDKFDQILSTFKFTD